MEGAVSPFPFLPPAMINRELELDRRQQRVDLAARSQEIAHAEKEHLRRLSYVAEEQESRRRRLANEEYERQEAAERRRAAGSLRKAREARGPEAAQARTAGGPQQSDD